MKYLSILLLAVFFTSCSDNIVDDESGGFLLKEDLPPVITLYDVTMEADPSWTTGIDYIEMPKGYKGISIVIYGEASTLPYPTWVVGEGVIINNDTKSVFYMYDEWWNDGSGFSGSSNVFFPDGGDIISIAWWCSWSGGATVSGEITVLIKAYETMP